MLGDDRLDLFGDVFDGARAFVLTALQRPTAARASFQPVLTAGIDPLGSLTPVAQMAPLGAGLLAPLGCVRLGVDGHHTRRRGRRWNRSVGLRLQSGDEYVLLGNAFARSQKCQDDDFGIVLAESQRLRSAECAAYRGVDERADRLRLPWLHVGLHTSAKASAQTCLS